MKNGSQKKALVVENDEQLLACFRSLLEGAGLEAHATWSGRDALSALKAGGVDVLLVDDYLPDLHVSEFLQRAAQLGAQPPIVVMQSAPPRASAVRRFEALGAAAVVDKRDPAAVRQAVLSCCSNRDLQESLMS